VRKGDSFVIECSYTTSEASGPKKFGQGSRDEMCIDFLFHYPQQKTPSCQFSREGEGNAKTNPKALPWSGINRVFG
jgi:hypothetical protein